MNNKEVYPPFDEASLSAARQGDAAALARLFQHYDPMIRSVPAWPKWGFSPPVQEDLCQTIRLQLQKCLPAFTGESSLEFYVKSICIHRCIDELRCQIKLRKLLVPLIRESQDASGESSDESHLKEADAVDPSMLADLGERAAALRRILESLEDPCRSAIQMFYFEGLSYKEMSERLGISVVTVGTRLGKCLFKLRHILSRDVMFKEAGGKPRLSASGGGS